MRPRQRLMLAVLVSLFSLAATGWWSPATDPNDDLEVIGIDLGAYNARVGLMRSGEIEVFTHELDFLRSPHDELHPDKSVDAQYEQAHVTKSLNTLKERASKHWNATFNKAVIAVPNYFNDTQRQTVKDGALDAGVQVRRIVNKSVAAGIAHGLDRMAKPEQFLVIELNEKAFSVTLVETEDGIFENLATDSIPGLGVEAFDGRLMDYFERDFRDKHGIVLTRIDSVLKTKAAQARNHILSFGTTDFDVQAPYNGRSYLMHLSRAMYEDLTSSLLKDCLNSVHKVVKEAKVGPNKITKIVFVGSATHIPNLTARLSEPFGDIKAYTGTNPEEAIVRGVAIQAGVLSGYDGSSACPIGDVISLSLGLETAGGLMTRMIPRNTVIPTRKTRMFTTAVDGQVSAMLRVFRGERALVEHNDIRGTLELHGLPDVKAGVPRIQVTYEFDANERLVVVVEEQLSGIRNSSILPDQQSKSWEEIESHMVETEKELENDAMLAANALVVNGVKNDALVEVKVGHDEL